MKHLQICMFDSDFYLQQVWILHLDVKNQKCPTSKIREVWKTTFTFLNVFYIFLNFYVGAVGINRSPSLTTLLYKFYLNQAAARAHFSPKKCTRHKKSKSHFSNFSNFWPSTFFKIKKISELCRCNSHLAVSDDSYYCIFSVLHMDTKNDPFLSRPSMFVCPTNFFYDRKLPSPSSVWTLTVWTDTIWTAYFWAANTAAVFQQVLFNSFAGSIGRIIINRPICE